jgi:hypothetical protein
VYSRLAWPEAVPWRVDQVVSGGEEMMGGIRATDVERDDEMALWLPSHRTLLFGDGAAALRAATSTAWCPGRSQLPARLPPQARTILLTIPNYVAHSN